MATPHQSSHFAASAPATSNDVIGPPTTTRVARADRNAVRFGLCVGARTREASALALALRPPNFEYRLSGKRLLICRDTPQPFTQTHLRKNSRKNTWSFKIPVRRPQTYSERRSQR